MCWKRIERYSTNLGSTQTAQDCGTGIERGSSARLKHLVGLPIDTSATTAPADRSFAGNKSLWVAVSEVAYSKLRMLFFKHLVSKFWVVSHWYCYLPLELDLIHVCLLKHIQLVGAAEASAVFLVAQLTGGEACSD